MFIAELNLYVNFLKEQLENETPGGLDPKRLKYYIEFFKNLKEGILFYKRLPQSVETNIIKFIKALNDAETELDLLKTEFSIQVPEKIPAATINLETAMAN